MKIILKAIGWFILAVCDGFWDWSKCVVIYSFSVFILFSIWKENDIFGKIVTVVLGATIVGRRRDFFCYGFGCQSWSGIECPYGMSTILMSECLPPRRRLRVKKGRCKPVAEFTCTCGAYHYPHRFGGGACNGGTLVAQWWENRACGDCKHIAYDSWTFVPYCQVVEGGERLEECGMLQEFIQRNEIHIKGINWK